MHNNKILNNIVEKIRSSKRSVVFSHQNPDGDTLGSMLALGALLKKSGHVVDHIIHDPVPEIYKFLPYTELVQTPDKVMNGQRYELAFSLDCGSLKRLGTAKEIWLKAETTINIDHHISNENFGKINFIEADAVSTGQVVYELAKHLGVKITKEIATLLYTTLLTDTGCFSNSKTDASALSWGAELINLGAEHENVYKKAFLERPYKAIRLFGYALSAVNSIEGGKVLWTSVNRSLMNELSATSEDAEDIVDYMMRTKGVLVGVFFREDELETKVSLRSSIDEVDVSKIAISLGGGGHKKAAGINIKKPFNEVRDLILHNILSEVKTKC